MTKNDLKGIIKECLLELLAEGLPIATSQQSAVKLQSEHRTVQQLPKQKQKQSSLRSSPLDERVGQSPALKEAVTTITDDPLMQSIFADSAATVQRQNRQGHNQEGLTQLQDSAARVMADADPLDVFEGSDRWAKLAF